MELTYLDERPEDREAVTPELDLPSQTVKDALGRLKTAALELHDAVQSFIRDGAGNDQPTLPPGVKGRE